MKASDLLQWWFLFLGFSVAMPGRIWRRQAQTSSDTCTCPSNGPTTTTVSQYSTFVSYSTLTIVDSTVYSTGQASTSVVTVSMSSTITVTDGISTIVDAGITTTTTTLRTTTSTIIATRTQTTCVASAIPKVKRQTNSTPSSISTAISVSSRSLRCVCRLLTQPTGLAGTSTSTCQCPATTGTTITSTTGFTATTTIYVVNTTKTTITVTPSATSTSMIMVTVTSSGLATTETTQGSLTVTRESVVTVYTTFTATIFSCPPTTRSSSSTITQSSSTSTRSSSTALALATDRALTCNSTAYLIATPNNDVPKLYNIDLRTSKFFTINTNVGSGKYQNINGMGYNILDNYLYAVGQLKSSNTTYDVLRISSTGSIDQIGSFISFGSSLAASSGDVDSSGNLWIAGTGGLTWRQINVIPGSPNYGKTINNGTMTLTGYHVYDWVYLPGNGSYLYSLAISTDSTPNLAMLRWSTTSHQWSTYQDYQAASVADSSGIIANWGSQNGTVWGLAAKSGEIARVVLGGQPVDIGSAPAGLENADGARCVLAT